MEKQFRTKKCSCEIGGIVRNCACSGAIVFPLSRLISSRAVNCQGDNKPLTFISISIHFNSIPFHSFAFIFLFNAINIYDDDDDGGTI